MSELLRLFHGTRRRLLYFRRTIFQDGTLWMHTTAPEAVYFREVLW